MLRYIVVRVGNDAGKEPLFTDPPGYVEADTPKKAYEEFVCGHSEDGWWERWARIHGPHVYVEDAYSNERVIIIDLDHVEMLDTFAEYPESLVRLVIENRGEIESVRSKTLVLSEDQVASVRDALEEVIGTNEEVWGDLAREYKEENDKESFVRQVEFINRCKEVYNQLVSEDDSLEVYVVEEFCKEKGF